MIAENVGFETSGTEAASPLGYLAPHRRHIGDAGEIADLLHVPKQSVYRMVREGRIPHFWIGRYVRFDLGTIEKWIDAGGTGLENK
jgi:excisionase family DNA binding protein